jgi:hypothetical protein
LEEVLLISPYAWNVHAKLGEVLYLSADRLEGEAQRKALAESMKRFCRSLELCDNYLRGFYGLKLVSMLAHDTFFNLKGCANYIHKTTSRLLQSTASAASESSAPATATIQRLNELATAKLAEIVRRSTSGEKDWDGYSQNEILAARALLAQTTAAIQR